MLTPQFLTVQSPLQSCISCICLVRARIWTSMKLVRTYHLLCVMLSYAEKSLNKAFQITQMPVIVGTDLWHKNTDNIQQTYIKVRVLNHYKNIFSVGFMTDKPLASHELKSPSFSSFFASLKHKGAFLPLQSNKSFNWPSASQGHPSILIMNDCLQQEWKING